MARSFSGDKAQLVPFLKTAIRHRGFPLVDVISPCVAFNGHEGSTKGYRYTREHLEAAVEADVIPPMAEITASYDAGAARAVTLPDGTEVRFLKVPEHFDPGDRDRVCAYLRERQRSAEIPTGLLYLKPAAPDNHDLMETVDPPSWTFPSRSSARGRRRWRGCSGTSGNRLSKKRRDRRFHAPAAPRLALPGSRSGDACPKPTSLRVRSSLQKV